MEASMSSPKCELDEDGCVRLSGILQAFNAAISEEHAWAVCYQTAKCMQREWAKDRYACCCLTSAEQIRIHKDGTVQASTVRDDDSGVTRTLATSEYKLVASLGLIIYQALDYGLCENEERLLSQPLEILIDRMASADPDEASNADDDSSSGSGEDPESLQTVDEGIERDAGDDDDDEEDGKEGESGNGLTLATVLEMCAAHLPCPDQADSHYKAVCRALVAEVLELSSFLETISKGTQELKTLGPCMEIESASKLDALEFPDWARLWMQVIRQLRQGVKLKKVDMHPHPHPIEYELTPYEMLLDDIRSRRYKLNKVMVNGDLPPRVKKDAHALILEFIRTRPPLNPVSRRKLRPAPPRQQTLYEKLMDSIRQPEHKLRPTPFKSRLVETSRTKLQEEDMTPQPRRRLIKADMNLRLSMSFDDDDDDEPPSPLSYDTQLTSLPPTNAISARTSPTWSRDPSVDADSPDKPERRHSISVCESPAKPGQQRSATDSTSVSEAARSNGTLAKTRLFVNGTRTPSPPQGDDEGALECLSLTLKEIVHIRQVLTKAEVEAIIGDRSLYEEVLKGKVCFTCKKTRFSFFGPWGVKCKICQRTVCDRCSTKMNLPTDPSANIPIYLLTPTPSPPSEEEEVSDEESSSFFKFTDAFGFATAPKHPDVERLRQPPATEPAALRRVRTMQHSESLHAVQSSSAAVSGRRRPSTPASSSTPRRPPLLRAKTVGQRGSLPRQQTMPAGSHPSVSVCRECKALVRHLIQADLERAQAPGAKERSSKSWPMRGLALKACPAMCLSTIVQSPPPTAGAPSDKHF